MEQNTLVYGIIDQNLVFAIEDFAIENARLWNAVKHAKTWQDFINLTSEETYQDLIFEILETLGYEHLYTQYLSGEDLTTYVPGLVLPEPDDEFTTDVLPGFDEGEYIPNLIHETLAWLPDELIDQIGEIDHHETEGFTYRIDPESELLAVQTLNAAGFATIPNQELIDAAFGR